MESEIILLPWAEQDLQESFEYYEAFQEGRGVIFLHCVDLALTSMRQFPEAAPMIRRPWRRRLVRGFPYGIFYSVEGRRLIVSGVIDLRQDPQRWQQRVQGRD